MSVVIRPARPEDAPAVAAIYNEGIAGRQATFETRPREADEVAAWLDPDLPFLVAQDDAGSVVGFARVSRSSARAAYAGVGEHTVYVAGTARRRGIGHELLEELCAAAERSGFHKLTSRVFSINAASRATHRSAGFGEVGVQRNHARLEGEWRDVVVVERLLGEAAG